MINIVKKERKDIFHMKFTDKQLNNTNKKLYIYVKNGIVIIILVKPELTEELVDRIGKSISLYSSDFIKPSTLIKCVNLINKPSEYLFYVLK